MSAAPRQRLSADERRTQVVDAAIRRFAIGGLAGTSTEDIAADVELSQPYLFRLFRTKRDLFLACADECHRRIGAVFAAADPGEGDVATRLDAMGRAYGGDVATDMDLLRFQMQMYTASSDPVVQEHVREGYRALVRDLRERTGAPADVLWEFFATGMMINTMVTLGFGKPDDSESWVDDMCDPRHWDT